MATGMWQRSSEATRDAPAGGGSGGGRGLSSLVMIAKGRESLCFALWVRAILDEKRMTGESVNFRLNQMDFVAFILHA